MTYTHAKVKVEGYSVKTLEWKPTDGQTDGGDCITSRASAVGKYPHALVTKLLKWKKSLET